MNDKVLIERVNYLLGQAQVAHDNKIVQGDSSYIRSDLYIGFKSISLSFIGSLYGENHTYYNMFKGAMVNSNLYAFKQGVSILQSIKHELEDGWLTTIRQIVSAEVFSDFLEMSEHLLEEGYKDASAVMIGSTLEEHLRQLCPVHKVDLHIMKGVDKVAKKAAQLNDDLKKANVYGPIQQKQVTAWLGTRNSAAHGHYSDYTLAEVKLMYQGVLNFLATVK